MKQAIGIAVVLVLAGCSSPSTWVKNDDTQYTNLQLSNALEQCRYKEAMKTSSALMIKASHHAQSVAKPASANVANSSKWRSVESARYTGYEAKKNQSVAIVDKANQCMQDMKFIRV